jgi:crotonobetainyl-CoA:carnitine CoA-transferase CaiB-like acyl-CoA transferase
VGHAALEELIVLDFSRILAGPLATMLLGDYGATVIKVERPGSGDDTRSWTPPRDADGAATYFLSVNRNKRSVALDLTDPDQLETARELAGLADVVVENFRPGVMERLGLGYERLSESAPGLIYCSITGFGTGPGARMPGYDLLVQALGGLMSITGSPDSEPQKVGVALVDVIAGLFAATGILAALRHRDTTGEGQLVEVNLLSAALVALANQASAYTAAGVIPRRMGNAHPSIAPYELLPTAQGDLVLAVGNDSQFASLCRVLGASELSGDPRFLSNDDRVQNRAELRAELERKLARAPAAHWVAPLIEAGVPAGEVNDIEAAFGLATRLGLEPIVEVAGDDGRSVRLPRNPVRMSATSPRYDAPPPELGELTIPGAFDLVGRSSASRATGAAAMEGDASVREGGHDHGRRVR